MKRVLQLIALLVSGVPAFAQQYELGEVTKEELEQKTHPTETSAGAAILFSKGTTYMVYSDAEGFELMTDVEMKIKIYTKDGYDFATKEVAFYNAGSQKETVSVSKAVTYNLVDGAIKKTKLKNEGEFVEEVNKNWKLKKIVMPDVKEGSVIEYKYTIKSPFISVFPEWRFQEAIPVMHSEYVTKIPEYYTFNPTFRGYHHPAITRTTANRSFASSNREAKEGSFVATEMAHSKIEYQDHITTYKIDNVPAMKNERFVSNIDTYTSTIEHELATIKYPNQPGKSFATTWEDVVKTIYDSPNFGPELKKTGYFEKDIDALIAGLTTPQEKAAAIFSYVKNRMNWNDTYGYFCDAGVKKAYNDKVGNVAEINLMLTAMLRYAKISANPVLVTTRSQKIALFPNRTAFNYVISAIEVNNQVVLLDATAGSSLPNILPVRALNWMGKLIRPDGSSTNVDLMPQMNSKEVINISAQIDKDGKVTGKARDQYFDYNAFVFRESYGGVNKDNYVENMEKRYKGIEVNEYTVANDKDLSKPVVEDYTFAHNNLSEVIGDKMYVNPMLYFAEAENPFTQEKREYPIDFIFPHQDKYMINITIPEGYMIESSPAPVSMAMEENIGSFKYNIVAKNNLIQLNYVFDINFANVSADYYKTLQQFYQKMIEKQNEKIVLKKV